MHFWFSFRSSLLKQTEETLCRKVIPRRAAQMSGQLQKLTLYTQQGAYIKTAFHPLRRKVAQTIVRAAGPAARWL